MKLARAAVLVPFLLALGACDLRFWHSGSKLTPVYSVANRCFAVGAVDRGKLFPKLLSVAGSDDAYGFSYRWPWRATPFFLKPSGLGTYLFYDADGSYLVSDGTSLGRKSQLLSDVLLVDDSFESDAEWALEKVGRRHHRASAAPPPEVRALPLDGRPGRQRQRLLAAALPARGLRRVPRGQRRRQRPGEGPALPGRLALRLRRHPLPHPVELRLRRRRHLPRRSVPSARHRARAARLRALPRRRGTQGPLRLRLRQPERRPDDAPHDLPGPGRRPTANHATAGWPDFTDWPNAHKSSTHQVQYYKWLERAYLGGLRLVVQHATTQPDHLRSHRGPGRPARPLLVQRHGGRRPDHRRDLPHAGLHRRPGGRARARAGSAS